MQKREIVANLRGKSNSDQRILKELRDLKRLSEPKKNVRWYDKIHSYALLFAKYVGIPGVLIAAIGPIEKLFSDIIEYHNKSLIQHVYLDYASTLMKEGSFERANRILATLESQKDFDARLQYYKAKVLIAIAIQQGRNYTEALDTASILSQIAEEGGVFFYNIGQTDDLIELNFSVVDILIAQQRYEEALRRIGALDKQSKFISRRLYDPSKNLRVGTIYVLQYNTSQSKEFLTTAMVEGDKINQKLIAANAAFQLGKAFQFESNNEVALKFYNKAIGRYEEIQDRFGLLRAYNNKAMIYFNESNNDESRNWYNREQILARELGDELGYARATNNIAIIEKKEKNYPSAIRLALEALGVFRQQHNVLGIDSSASLLANIYSLQGNYAEALAYAKENLASSMQLRELRGVTAGCGTLSNIYANLRDKNELAFSSLCAAALIKHLNLSKSPATSDDLDIFISRITQIYRASLEGQSTVESAKIRVKDIFIALNVDTANIDDVLNRVYAQKK